MSVQAASCASPPAPVVASLGQRPVRAGDEDFLFTVYASSREDEMAGVDWSEAMKAAFFRSQCALQRRDIERRFPRADHALITLEGRPMGRIWVNRGEEEMRLLDIVLLAPYRHRGIGAHLITRLQNEASERHQPLRLCVLKTRPRVIAFYDRLGFQPSEDLGLYHLMQWSPGKVNDEGVHHV